MISLNSNNNNNNHDVDMYDSGSGNGGEVVNEGEDNELFCSILCGDTDLLKYFTSGSNGKGNGNGNNLMFIPYIVIEILSKSNNTKIEEFIKLKEQFIYSPIYSKIVYNIGQYEKLDYIKLNEFIKNEISIRKKLSHLSNNDLNCGNGNGKKDTFFDSIDNPKLHFENGSNEMKMKLVLSDIIALLEFSDILTSSVSSSSSSSTPNIHQQQQQQQQQPQQQQPKFEALFIDTPIYNNELNIILPLITFKCLKHIEFNKLIISILFLNQSGYLISLILLNCPNEFNEIIEVVLSSVGIVGTEKIKRVLMEICKLSKYCSRLLRSELMNRQMLPDLVLLITSQFIKDEIELLGNIISNRQENQWLKEYISQNNQQSTFNEIRDSLLSTLEKINSSGNNNNNMEQSFIVKSIIRLYCGFSGLLGIKMNQNEISISLQFIEKSNCYSKIFLCFLLVCEGLVKSITAKRVIGYLNHLGKFGNCNELLLLVSIYFHTHQLQNIALIVKNILGFRPSIHTESLNAIGELLTKEIYTESLVAKKSIQLSPISQLNNNDFNNLSIVCVYHLLSERIFEKYETDVTQWCWNQIELSTTPCHYLIPSLLDQLVKNIIEPSISTSALQSSSSSPFYMKRIQESQITNSINNAMNSSNLPVVILIVYFTLRYNDSVFKFKSEPKSTSISGCGGSKQQNQFLIETTQQREYTIEFLSKLPIQLCINTILANQSLYFYIIPPFLYLILSQFPQFFNINLLLIQEERLSNPIEKFIFLPNFYNVSGSGKGNGNGNGMTNEFLKNCLENTLKKPTSVQLVIRYLNTLPVVELLPFTNTLLDTLLPILINNRSLSFIDGLISPFTEIWERVFPISQSSIALKTINILTTTNDGIGSNSSGTPFSKYTYTDIISDPLMIFRCHPTVFTCPPLFKILLQILFFYMVSSKKNLQNQLHGSGGGSSVSNKQHQEDISTLILTQESSIIQILLEICIIDKIDTKIIMGNNNVSSSYDPVDIEEIRCMIGNFIHQIFIDKPLIIKLIHFQGYNAQLLPITVTLIPSMHICFEFIPELLSQPILDKQIFAIQLTSYLSEKFPIPKSLKLIKQCQLRISYNLNSANSSGIGVGQYDKFKFLHLILPAITRITKTFPLVAEDFITILMEQLPNKNNYQQNLKSQISTINLNFNSNLKNSNNSTLIQNNNGSNNNNDNDNSLSNIEFDDNNNNNGNNNNSIFKINNNLLNNFNDKSFYNKISKNDNWKSIKESNDHNNNTFSNIPIEQEIHQAIQIIIKNLSK